MEVARSGLQPLLLVSECLQAVLKFEANDRVGLKGEESSWFFNSLKREQ